MKSFHKLITAIYLVLVISSSAFSQISLPKVSPPAVTLDANANTSVTLTFSGTLQVDATIQWQSFDDKNNVWNDLIRQTSYTYKTKIFNNSGPSELIYRYRVKIIGPTGNLSYTNEAVIIVLPSMPVIFSYDSDGNLSSRQLLISKSSSSSLKSMSPDNDLPDISAILTNAGFPDPKPGAGEDLLNNIKITIYPNPTRGNLQIDLNGSIPENSKMIIYSAFGVVVKKINNISYSNLLDISSYPSGIYILYIYIDNEMSVWKITKE